MRSHNSIARPDGKMSPRLARFDSRQPSPKRRGVTITAQTAERQALQRIANRKRRQRNRQIWHQNT